MIQKSNCHKIRRFDICLDKTKEKIFDFLDDDLGNFIETSNQFDPKKSQNNTFLWEKENSSID